MKAELCEEVRRSQAAGRMTDKLVEMVTRIGRRYSRRLNRDDTDDVVQDVLVSLVVSLHRIDPEQNCFSYITTTVANSVNKTYRCHSHQKELARVLLRHQLQRDRVPEI